MWLASQSAGKKTEKDSKCTMNQVAAILVAVDPNAEERLGGCLERVETRFIEPSEMTLQASTVRNDLFGLKRFCDFLILKESQNLSKTEHD